MQALAPPPLATQSATHTTGPRSPARRRRRPPRRRRPRPRRRARRRSRASSPPRTTARSPPWGRRCHRHSRRGRRPDRRGRRRSRPGSSWSSRAAGTRCRRRCRPRAGSPGHRWRPLGVTGAVAAGRRVGRAARRTGLHGDGLLGPRDQRQRSILREPRRLEVQDAPGQGVGRAAVLGVGVGQGAVQPHAAHAVGLAVGHRQGGAGVALGEVRAGVVGPEEPGGVDLEGRVQGAGAHERALGPGEHLPLGDAGLVGRLGRAVEEQAVGVQVVRVGHARGGFAVVEQVHDARARGVHPQLGHDVFALVVEQVVALGERPAVRTQVGPDAANRTVAVGDEGALGRGVGEHVPAAIVGTEAGLVQVEDVDAGGVARGDAELVGHPPGGEVAAVGRPLHRRVLGHRGVAGGVAAAAPVAVEVVLRLVVDPVEGHGVPHVVLPSGGIEGVALSRKEVDPGDVFAVGEGELHPRARHHAVGLAPGAHPVAGVPGHEHHLVVEVEGGVGVGPREGLGVGVEERRHHPVGLAGGFGPPPPRALAVDLAEVLHQALVHLDGDGLPGAVAPGEGHDVAGRDRAEPRELRPQDDHRVFGPREASGRVRPRLGGVACIGRVSRTGRCGLRPATAEGEQRQQGRRSEAHGGLQGVQRAWTRQRRRNETRSVSRFEKTAWRAAAPASGSWSRSRRTRHSEPPRCA